MVSKDRGPFDGRRDLLEEFKPFSAQAVFELHEARGITARSRQTLDDAGADGIGDEDKHERHGSCRLQKHCHGCAAANEDDLRCERSQFHRVFANVIGAAATPAIVDPEVAALDPAQLCQHVAKHSVARVHGCFIGDSRERAQAPNAWFLLCAGGERPNNRMRRRRATQKGDELAPPHSITSSARPSSIGEISRPSALAVLRLITNSNLTGPWTGSSLGFAPLRMRSA